MTGSAGAAEFQGAFHGGEAEGGDTGIIGDVCTGGGGQIIPEPQAGGFHDGQGATGVENDLPTQGGGEGDGLGELGEWIHGGGW